MNTKDEALMALANSKTTKKSSPLWEGPQSNGPQGGISYSTLSRFLCCRERFRLLVVEGLKPFDGFNHRIEYGNMFHLCCESFTKHGHKYWGQMLMGYAKQLCQIYSTAQDQIDYWYNMCKMEFPLYLQYWDKDQSSKFIVKAEPEQVFKVPYKLPSGRVVYLRGKWDNRYLVKGSSDSRVYQGKWHKDGVWVMETKTKQQIVEHQILRQLRFDLQTMMYCTAFRTWQDLDDYGEPVRTPEFADNSLVGIVYNVIRRPAQRLTKKENLSTFLQRVKTDVIQQPEHYFMRWKVEIAESDIILFRRQCFDPILEQLCDWYDFVVSCMPEVNKDNLWKSRDGLHFRFPYGVYNPLLEGGTGDLDDYMDTGRSLTVEECSTLFPELEG